MEKEYFAAIDIGTNAGRLLIGYVIPQNDHLSVKKALLTRVPLRLGEEVFRTGKISKEREEAFIHAMKGFSHLMLAYGVKNYRAVATSAMREAKNGPDISKRINDEAGLSIDVIDGEEEARLIFNTFQTQKLDHQASYLFIDVGGGSTELSIIKYGKRVKSKSFKIGTLRLKSGRVKPMIWGDIEAWLNDSSDLLFEKGHRINAICTGGNANRLIKLNNKKYLEPLTVHEIRDTRNHVAKFSLSERVELLRLKPDRADVLIPATDIYLNIMEMVDIQKMYVPKMGLADGIILNLHESSIEMSV